MSASRFDERRRNHRITVNKGNRLQNTCSKSFRATTRETTPGNLLCSRDKSSSREARLSIYARIYSNERKHSLAITSDVKLISAINLSRERDRWMRERQTEEDKTGKFHEATFIARWLFALAVVVSATGEETYEKARRHSVKSSKSSSVSWYAVIHLFFLPSPTDPSSPAEEKRATRSRNFSSKRTASGDGRAEDVRWRQSLERNCRFPVFRALGTRSVEKAAPGIASSASHNPAVMAFDSYDRSDNCNDDRAAFFASSSY